MDQQDLVAQLVEAVRAEGPNRGMLSSKIGSAIRDLDPNFSPRKFGVNNLREFIDQHVPQLRVIGSYPNNIVYGLANWPDLPEAPPEDLWRTWVSPNARKELAINTESGAVRSVWIGKASSDEVVVPPVNRELLRKLSEDFVHLVPEDQRDSFLEALEVEGEWWPAWLRALRSQPPQLQREYREHREKVLEEELHARLHDAEALSDAAEEVALEAILKSRGASRRTAPRESKDGRRAHVPVSHPADSSVRKVVHRVVDLLSDRELREIWLPVGATLDAVRGE